MVLVDTTCSVPADVRDVLDAAALLHVTEFHLFHIAYRFWHGRETDDPSIERYFVPYMFRSVVPFWVRQLCRQILQADARGTLDPAQYGIARPCPPAPVPYSNYVAVFGAIVGMVLVAASLYLSY
jgi:hypothetical protein